MGLLYKKDELGNYIELKKILKDGYEIDEQPNLIAKKQFANGKRKKIVTFYTDCTIKIRFDMFTLSTYLEYKDYLTDGIYKYMSNDGTLKEAEFIVTNPPLEISLALQNNTYINEFEVLLEKSDEVD